MPDAKRDNHAFRVEDAEELTWKHGMRSVKSGWDMASISSRWAALGLKPIR